MIIKGNNNEYEVGEVIANLNKSRIRKCVDSDGNELLIQIAVEAKYNENVARNSHFLGKLKEQSDGVEKRFAKKNKGLLNYNLGFPNLVDSFIFKEQGSRYVNIIGFNGIDSFDQLTPIVRIWKQGNVDLPTSAWMMGKALKMLSFAHDCNISPGNLSGNNVLVGPDNHFVVFFDWSDAESHTKVPRSTISGDIKKVAGLILKAVGEGYEADNEADEIYFKFISSLKEYGSTSASLAHKEFYTMVDSLCSRSNSTWTSGFHQFTLI